MFLFFASVTDDEKLEKNKDVCLKVLLFDLKQCHFALENSH